MQCSYLSTKYFIYYLHGTSEIHVLLLFLIYFYVLGLDTHQNKVKQLVKYCFLKMFFANIAWIFRILQPLSPSTLWNVVVLILILSKDMRRNKHHLVLLSFSCYKRYFQYCLVEFLFEERGIPYFIFLQLPFVMEYLCQYQKKSWRETATWMSCLPVYTMEGT